MPWLTGWNHRKAIVISNTGPGLTDYQMQITLDTATLITDGQMLSNCDDIRFTDSDGYLISHWLEYGCNTSLTTIWVKIPNIPTGTKTIYVYYGNPTAPNVSNADATFILFDDFTGTTINALKWIAETGASIVNSQLKLYGSSNVAKITSVIDINFDNTIIDIDVNKMDTPSGTENIILYARSLPDRSRYIMMQNEFLNWGPAGHNFYTAKNNGTFTEIRHQGNYWATNTWYHFKMNILPSSFSTYLYNMAGNLIDSITDMAYNPSTMGNKLLILQDSAGNNGTAYVDNIRIRKYASPEPTYTIPICTTLTCNLQAV